MAANPLATELAGGLGVKITWVSWALGAVVPGLVSLLLVPAAIYYLSPPSIKETPEAARMAKERLGGMGLMKKGEWLMLGTFCLLLGLWIFGKNFGIQSTAAALIGLSVLLLSGVLTWSDVCRETEAWNTLIWFAALVMMARYLNEFGFVPWLSETIGASLSNYHWFPTFLGLSIVYFYSHYLFASNTAHVSSMYAPFLGIALAVGAPPLVSALVLAYFSNLFSGTTHYGCGAAPIFFGANFMTTARWWRTGGLISVLNISIWLGVGGVWWRILGHW